MGGSAGLVGATIGIFHESAMAIATTTRATTSSAATGRTATTRTRLFHGLDRNEQAQHYRRPGHPRRPVRRACAQALHSDRALHGRLAGNIYAAVFPENVTRVITIGSPVDFTAGGGKIQEFVQSTPNGFFVDLVAMFGGRMSGDWMLAAWKAMDPVGRYVTDPAKYQELALSPEGPDKGTAIEKTRRNRSWYETTIDLGQWYIQACEDLFRDNKLVRGELRVLGHRADPHRITRPFTRVWGGKAEITPAAQAFFSADCIGTPPDQVEDVTIPGAGHIGAFIGAKSQPVLAEVFKKSGHNLK